MKFLMVASFPDSLLRFRGPLIDALVARGCRVHVAAPDLGTDSPLRRQLESKGVVAHTIPLSRTGLNPFADLATLFHLFRLMRAIRPALVLAYTIKPVIYGSLAAAMARVPRRFALVTGLGYAFQNEGGRGLVSRVARQLYAIALRSTHKVFFQNPDDRTLFRSLGILSSRTPSQVLNGSGVDLTEYVARPLPVETRFLFIGRLLGDKGVREYVEAARLIRCRHPDVKCDLVGWIDENPNAIREDELDRWVAEETISYLGRLDDVRPAIACSSVFVLPSYREGTPRTVLEAMAMGRAIITTDAPGCRQTVVDGENGFLVPVRSVSELVAAMERFIADPALAARMGERSRKIVEERFDVDKVNAVMLQEMGIA